MTVNRGCYVYALIDPRDAMPFYIGKGTATRRFQHFRKLPSDVEASGAKAQRIREIKQAGFKPQAIVLSWHANDEEALDAERAAIAKIGRDKLTNARDGGGGDKSKSHSKPKHDTSPLFLSAQQERFAQLVASGVNQSDAYRQSYEPKRANDATIHKRACELRQHPKIAGRIEQLIEPVKRQIVVDRAFIYEKLIDALELAMDTDQPGAAVSAAEKLAKLEDMFPAEKRENRNYDMSDITSRIQKGRERVANLKRVLEARGSKEKKR
jgi:hypothetical protein